MRLRAVSRGGLGLVGGTGRLGCVGFVGRNGCGKVLYLVAVMTDQEDSY